MCQYTKKLVSDSKNLGLQQTNHRHTNNENHIAFSTFFSPETAGSVARVGVFAGTAALIHSFQAINMPSNMFSRFPACYSRCCCRGGCSGAVLFFFSFYFIFLII